MVDNQNELFEAKNPKRKLSNQDKLHTSMTVFEQIGVNRTNLVKVMSSRKWFKTLPEVVNKLW